jgi:5,10-methylenetetrahydromethanopterin reductase
VQHKLWGSSYVAAVSDWAEGTKPVKRLREAVEVIRRMLAESHVTFDGEFFKCPGLSSTAKKVGKLPIYIGRMSGPLTFRLAGEVGDGIMLSYGYSREYFR